MSNIKQVNSGTKGGTDAPVKLVAHDEVVETSKLEVITDGEVRALVSFCDLPESAAKAFEHVGEECIFDERFVLYRDEWYDTSDTQWIRVSKQHDRPMGWALYVDPSHPFAAWDSVISETFFSGVLFRFVYDDPDRDDGVVCGHYYS